MRAPHRGHSTGDSHAVGAARREGYAAFGSGRTGLGLFCVPLSVEGEARAALTLYARNPNAFSPEDIDVVEAFAMESSTALELVLHIANLTETGQHLNAALAYRATVDTALGLVMAQNRCTHEAAFSILERASSTRNVKLRDVAASIVSSVSGEEPSVHFNL